jgi:hypothetical protein
VIHKCYSKAANRLELPDYDEKKQAVEYLVRLGWIARFYNGCVNMYDQSVYLQGRMLNKAQIRIV